MKSKQLANVLIKMLGLSICLYAIPGFVSGLCLTVGAKDVTKSGPIMSAGLDVRDGRDDRMHNGIWISHGWFGADSWFIENKKTNEISLYHSPSQIHALAALLRTNHMTDVFPKLCPADPYGHLPAVNDSQIERFLDAFTGFRIIPWIGGPGGIRVWINDKEWRTNLVQSVSKLLASHPRLAGVQVGGQPLRGEDSDFITLLDELRAALPKDKILSVAAYPPPTRFQASPNIHWAKEYFRKVSQHSDQMAVMMFDTAVHEPKLYQYLTAEWTREVLDWSGSTPVLLAVPTYSENIADYHNPKVKILEPGLLGIHRGLAGKPLPQNYQGVALYCEWETDTNEWSYFNDHFLKR